MPCAEQVKPELTTNIFSDNYRWRPIIDNETVIIINYENKKMKKMMDEKIREKIVYNILKEYAKNNGLVEYKYPDRFYCFGNPDSQEMADKKHEEWLAKQKL